MPDPILEEYILQHIAACPGPVVHFSWHGGEPTLLGVDYFRKIVALQRKHKPAAVRLTNGIQTNGTLLNDDWLRFFAAENFAVGLSVDGPEEMHDQYRLTREGNPTYKKVMEAAALLRRHRIPCNFLCVVHARNVRHPMEVYRFFKQLKARYVEFLPLVEPQPEEEAGVSRRTAPAEAWGDFLCQIFDEWMSLDIEQIRVQIFEEVARVAFGQEHALCIFRQTCGDVPVIEHNGDFYSCDHFVDPGHRLGNIRDASLVDLLESSAQRGFGQAKFASLPRYCRSCEVLPMCHGGCPKDRILRTPDGEPGLNYLCAGLKRFFNHCRPFVAELSALWRSQATERPAPPAEAGRIQATSGTGRNDPCPCGSGKKYKKCCLGK